MRMYMHMYICMYVIFVIAARALRGARRVPGAHEYIPVMRVEFTSPIRFSGCVACASFSANAFGVSGACGAAGRFYD